VGEFAAAVVYPKAIDGIMVQRHRKYRRMSVEKKSAWTGNDPAA